MTYDHEVTLIDYTYTQDELRQQIPQEIRTTILCGIKSIMGKEFYNAAVSGIKPELVLVVHAFEYNGQTVVEFGGSQYQVIRTYATSMDELELTCGGGVGLGN